jgi:GAF domain-containing protein
MGEVRLLDEVSSAFAGSRGVQQRVRALLVALARGLGWDWAALWQRDGSGGLRALAVWHQAEASFRELEEATLQARFNASEGLPGRVLHAGAPLWLTEAELEPWFCRAGAASAAGLRSALFVPIIGQHGSTAVLELLSRAAQAPDFELLDTLTALGRQIAHVITHVPARRTELDPCGWKLEDRVVEPTARLARELYRTDTSEGNR